jgi:hypothetical protein
MTLNPNESCKNLADILRIFEIGDVVSVPFVNETGAASECSFVSTVKDVYQLDGEIMYIVEPDYNNRPNKTRYRRDELQPAYVADYENLFPKNEKLPKKMALIFKFFRAKWLMIRV